MSMHLTECSTVWPLRQTTTLRQAMVSTLYTRILSELFVNGVCLEAGERQSDKHHMVQLLCCQ